MNFNWELTEQLQKNDQGWQSIEDSTVYSDQEFQKFSDEFAHLSTKAPHGQEHLPRASETH